MISTTSCQLSHTDPLSPIYPTLSPNPLTLFLRLPPTFSYSFDISNNNHNIHNRFVL